MFARLVFSILLFILLFKFEIFKKQEAQAMDYYVNTDMTYISDQDDLYLFYLAYGIESVLMIADIHSYSYK